MQYFSDEDIRRLESLYRAFITKKTVPALSMLINEQATFVGPKAKEMGLDGIVDLTSSAEYDETDVGIYIKCDGDARLGILFHITLDAANKLIKILMGENSTEGISAEGRSALAEVGNIMAASFFNAINLETDYKIMSTVPGLAIDTIGALLESPIIENIMSEAFIYSKGKFVCQKANIEIAMSVFQDPSEAEKIIKSAKSVTESA